MIMVALCAGADDLDDKPSVTNTFYAALMRDSANRFSELQRICDFWKKQHNAVEVAANKLRDAHEELKRENAALREQLKEANRLLHIWSPESVIARKEAQP